MIDSRWVPAVGELFYVDSKRRFPVVSSGDTVTINLIEDQSYSETIFKCIAYDERALIGDIVHGGYGLRSRTILLWKFYKISPVGPSVSIALGLSMPSNLKLE